MLEPRHNQTNTDLQVKQNRAGYYAAVSWADYCAGQVLDELEALGLADDTAVVLHSDHGDLPLQCNASLQRPIPGRGADPRAV